MRWSLASWVISQLDLLRLELIAHAVEQQVDDLADLLDLQRAEDHDRVDAVQELRPELRLELVEDLVLHPVVLLLLSFSSVVATGRKPRLVSLSRTSRRRCWS